MWKSKCTCKNKWCIIPFDPHPKLLSSSLPNRTRLCEPNLVTLCRLKTLGVVQLYLPGRAHTQLCLGPSCIGSRHILQTRQLSQRGYLSVAYSRKALSLLLWAVAEYIFPNAGWVGILNKRPFHKNAESHTQRNRCISSIAHTLPRLCANVQQGCPSWDASDSLCMDPSACSSQLWTRCFWTCHCW